MIKENKNDLNNKAGDSILQSVTVYFDKALVSRMKKAVLKKGETVLYFTGLGNSIFEESIKVSLSEASVRLGTVMLEKNYTYEFKKEDDETVKQEMINLLEKLLAQSDFKMIAAAEYRYLIELREYLRQSAGAVLIEKENPMSRLKDGLNFISRRIQSNNQSQLKYEEEFEDLNRQYRILSDKLEKIRRLDKRIENSIKVVLESDTEKEIDVELSYLIANARWSPAYDFYADTLKGLTEVRCYADVTQNTGEDWNNTIIALSTARVDRSLAIPEIRAEFLSGSFRKREKTAVITDIDIKKEREESGEGTAPEEPEPEKPALQVENKGVSIHLKSAGLESVPSDGLTHKVFLTSKSLSTSLHYETVPEKMAYVFLKGTLTNELDFPLLAGDIHIYRNRSFMGKTRLVYTPVQSVLTYSLGIDGELSVKRRVIRDSTEAGGLMGQRNIHTRLIQYELYNRKKEPVSIILKESIYLSEIKEISVTVNNTTSEGYQKDKDGVVSWNVPVNPDPFLPLTLKLEYRIDYPQSFQLDL